MLLWLFPFPYPTLRAVQAAVAEEGGCGLTEGFREERPMLSSYDAGASLQL